MIEQFATMGITTTSPKVMQILKMYCQLQRISKDGQNGNPVKLAKCPLAIKKIKFNGVVKINKLPQLKNHIFHLDPELI